MIYTAAELMLDEGWINYSSEDVQEHAMGFFDDESSERVSSRDRRTESASERPGLGRKAQLPTLPQMSSTLFHSHLRPASYLCDLPPATMTPMESQHHLSLEVMVGSQVTSRILRNDIEA